MRKNQIKLIAVSVISTIFLAITIYLLQFQIEKENFASAGVLLAILYMAILYFINLFVNSNLEKLDDYLKNPRSDILKSIIFGKTKKP